jgi:DNA polymerase-3 subunit delta'
MVSEAFPTLLGQDQAIALLKGAIAANRIAPAYLFAGPSGVGRSLAARTFIELLFCTDIPTEKQPSVQRRLRQGNHPDVLWVEPTYLHNGTRLSATEAAQKGLQRKAPPQIRLEQIREIAQFLGRSALEASRKVVVLEQAETMAEAAANGLLKTLEEPGRATLILIAPSLESLLPTLVSRCQRIPFYRLAQENMEAVLRQTGHEEILKESSVLAIAQGSPGEAIAAFEQLQAIPDQLLTEVTQPPKSLRKALELAKEIDKTLDAETQLWLLNYLQHRYWQQFLVGAIHESPLQHLEKARSSLLSYAQPRLVWEVTLLKLSQAAVS